jgi:beta-N-acetylhexosaminidase
VSRLLNSLFAAALLVNLAAPALAHAPPQQGGSAAAIVARMTPLEKVGQLFVVTFTGPTAPAGSDIDKLVRQYHVGGVVLQGANDNFGASPAAPAETAALTAQLQAAAVAAAQAAPEAGAGQPGEAASPFVPLLIGLSPALDGAPLPGLTELPSAMAIGATWDGAAAEAVGRIAGKELAALGINLYIGPSLDVLDAPRPQTPGDLGAGTFGGDPFWVGVMGQAFTRGLHSGSAGRLAVFVTHFPGHGSSDRDPENEIPTVRKSLEQLKQIELSPFFAVTGRAGDRLATTDGLLTAHIRFQGFQGNIRQTTRPVSFDPQALGELLALDELAAWRQGGGVVMSDALGTRAVRRFFDPTETTFNARRVALEAFNAGNDLLYTARFGLTPRADQAAAVIDVIEFFAQKYGEDKVFAERVDAAAARVVGLKLHLYGQFLPDNFGSPAGNLEGLGQDEPAVLSLAEAAATLVAANSEELAPAARERVVFLTDTRLARPCGACDASPVLGKRALERAVLQLYGPEGSGQVQPGSLQSFGFDELATLLKAPPAVGAETPTPDIPPIAAALAQADWLVFNMLDLSADAPGSDVLSAVLAERPDLVRGKKIVVFAFNAPYYLDSTDVSKVTAFYAVYSHVPAFVEVAARLLFQTIPPRGAPPVSVAAVDYDLTRATAPDPGQVIAIYSGFPAAAGTPTAQPAGLKKGDVLHLRTGAILDRNGHPVPDGTPVRFQILYAGDELPAVREVPSSAGTAETDITLNRTGPLQITAVSEPALISLTLQIDVQENSPFFITVIAPTPAPTGTPAPQPSVTPDEATPSALNTPSAPGGRAGDRVSARDLFMLLLGLAAVTGAGYRLAAGRAEPALGLRLSLVAGIGALAGYNYFALALPGVDLGARLFGVLAPTAFVVLGGLLGLLGGWYGFVVRGIVPKD